MTGVIAETPKACFSKQFFSKQLAFTPGGERRAPPLTQTGVPTRRRARSPLPAADASGVTATALALLRPLPPQSRGGERPRAARLRPGDFSLYPLLFNMRREYQRMSREEAGTKEIGEYATRKAAARLQRYVPRRPFGTRRDGSQVPLSLADHTSQYTRNRESV